MKNHVGYGSVLKKAPDESARQIEHEYSLPCELIKKMDLYGVSRSREMYY
jgi:hypothetical protein